MKINRERLKRYLFDILSNLRDLENLFKEQNLEKILSNKHLIKSLKYSIVEICEASSLVLQHILAKYYGVPVKGYIDTLKKAQELGVISERLLSSLRPFFDFRNAIVHRYWSVEDQKVIKMCEEGYKEFFDFIESIESFIEKNR